MLIDIWISSKKDPTSTRDTDVIIVLNDIKSDARELFSFIFKNFHKIDFHIYSYAEIENDLSYFTREYVLEYLSKGLCIYGENIFKNKFKEVTKHPYTESVLIRSIEHVQMVRKVYFSDKYDLEYKIYYLNKYLIRLSKNILLFKDIMDYDSLDKLTNKDTLEILIQNGLLSECHNFNDENQKSPTYCYELFCDISTILLDCRSKLKSLYSK